jgi:hypothetical protein
MNQELIYERIAKLDAWLAEQIVDVKDEQAHLNEGSRERLYWNYGYMMALKDVIRRLEQ